MYLFSVPWQDRVTALNRRKIMSGLACALVVIVIFVVAGCIAVALQHDKGHFQLKLKRSALVQLNSHCQKPISE